MHYITQSAYRGDAPVVHETSLLYHLNHDPSEHFNVADKKPEILTRIEEEVSTHREALVIAPSQLRVPEWEQ